jgi:hypothetical protein
MNDDVAVVRVDHPPRSPHASSDAWELRLVNRASGEFEVIQRGDNPGDALGAWLPGRPTLVYEHWIACRTSSWSHDQVQPGGVDRMLLFSRPSLEPVDCYVTGRPLALSPTHLVTHTRGAEPHITIVERATPAVTAKVPVAWYSPTVLLFRDGLYIVSGTIVEAVSLDGEGG